MSPEKPTLQDVTDATGRQMLDDIFEESRMRREQLEGDVDASQLATLSVNSDPFIGFYRGTIQVNDEVHDDGEVLVVISQSQQRRYLLKRWAGHGTFKAYQITPVVKERLRLLNVYRVMIGQAVT